MCLLLQEKLVPPEAVKTAEDQTKTVNLSRLLTAPRATHDIDDLQPNMVQTIMLNEADSLHPEGRGSNAHRRSSYGLPIMERHTTIMRSPSGRERQPSTRLIMLTLDLALLPN